MLLTGCPKVKYLFVEGHKWIFITTKTRLPSNYIIWAASSIEENRNTHGIEQSARHRPHLRGQILGFKKKMTHAPPIHIKVSNFMLCQRNTKISARHSCQSRLRCSSWAELRRRSNSGGGVPETAPTQQNINEIFKFWLITKMAKISTQGREPVSPDLLVLEFNWAPEGQVSYGAC